MGRRMRRSTKGFTALLLLVGLFLNTSVNAQSWEDGMYRDGMHQMNWGGQLSTTTLSGKAIIDTSRERLTAGKMTGRAFFLDVKGDGSRSYEMYFGPYWYTPASGAKRPANGEPITVKAGLMSQMNPPMLVVYEINGKKWRDSIGAATWSGRWMQRGINDTTRAYCAIDSLSFAGFTRGFMGSGMMGGGMMWPDSLYCDFDEMHPDSLPGMPSGRSIMGYHLDTFDPQGQMTMAGGYQGHGMMGFQSQMRMRFHMNPDSLRKRGLTMNQVSLFHFDTDNQWKVVPNQASDLQAYTISFSSATAFSYYAIAPTGLTAVKTSVGTVPSSFTLDQNFPNPFNPSTRISFSITEGSRVSLVVFDLLGRQVAMLIDADLPAGTYSATFNAGNLSSGMYLYRLQAGSFVQEKRMQLLK
jgi:hypothetical protein